ncbi:MAG TPA: hypothetical protein VH325_07360 [Bryobacteraceae bacterium]|jgi:hypothetical protein|nr:hypothetical protein [Bryobacteraceae bacterium]
MNKLDLTLRLARESHRSRGKAADAVDNLVYELLKDLKQAGPATPKPKPDPKRSGNRRSSA